MTNSIDPLSFSAKVIPEVVSQHAEEAAFLWVLRERALRSPRYSLADLARIDQRIGAHLDGLLIASDPGWESCLQELGWEEPGEVFAAAAVALAGGRVDRVETVVRAAVVDAERRRALLSALAWSSSDQAQGVVVGLLESKEPIRTQVGLRAASLHRWDVDEPRFDAGTMPGVRAAWLRGGAESGRTDRLSHCLDATLSEHEELRFWGAWSALLLGHAAGLPLLRDIAKNAGPYAPRALEVVGLGMDPDEAQAWQNELAASAATCRAAIHVAGVIGDPRSVPWLLDCLAKPELCRLAGVALVDITGMDLESAELEGVPPGGFAAESVEDTGLARAELETDESLPWPAPEAVRAWCGERRASLRDGRRYLRGMERNDAAFADALNHGSQTQRRVAALALKLREPARELFDIRAPAKLQKARLRR
jgi:uncharacterized protein (TIGR02270 family)